MIYLDDGIGEDFVHPLTHGIDPKDVETWEEEFITTVILYKEPQQTTQQKE